MVIDFRALNKKTIEDLYPLPNINDMLLRLSGATMLSVMDLARGFYQVPMAPEDREKTAFSTPDEHYEFVRMPF